MACFLANFSHVIPKVHFKPHSYTITLLGQNEVKQKNGNQPRVNKLTWGFTEDGKLAGII